MFNANVKNVTIHLFKSSVEFNCDITDLSLEKKSHNGSFMKTRPII